MSSARGANSWTPRAQAPADLLPHPLFQQLAMACTQGIHGAGQKLALVGLVVHNSSPWDVKAQEGQVLSATEFEGRRPAAVQGACHLLLSAPAPVPLPLPGSQRALP